MKQFLINLWTLATSKDEVKLHHALQSVHRRAWRAAWNCGWNRGHENSIPARESGQRAWKKVELLEAELRDLRKRLDSLPSRDSKGRFKGKGQ